MDDSAPRVLARTRAYSSLQAFDFQSMGRGGGAEGPVGANLDETGPRSALTYDLGWVPQLTNSVEEVIPNESTR